VRSDNGLGDRGQLAAARNLRRSSGGAVAGDPPPGSTPRAPLCVRSGLSPAARTERRDLYQGALRDRRWRRQSRCRPICATNASSWRNSIRTIV